MGFAMVTEVMVQSLKDKPLIGHNLMYDALYFYNQFIDDLPDSYLLFAQKWSSIFSVTFDNKILAYNKPDMFNEKTILGDIYEKTKLNPELANIISIDYDRKNEMTKYHP